MVTRKRKKNSRQHGSTTHGWGARKKHRGKGNKGGAGMAGTGKRADSKKPMIWNDTKYFGKHGFHSHKKDLKTINVDDALKLQENGVVDLTAKGYEKLLGGGKITQKITIKVGQASAKAREKVKGAGGEVVTGE